MFDAKAALLQLAKIVGDPNDLGYKAATDAVISLNRRNAWLVPCIFQETGANRFLARVLWEEVTVHIPLLTAEEWRILFASFCTGHPEGVQKDEGAKGPRGWMVISVVEEEQPVRRRLGTYDWYDADR